MISEFATTMELPPAARRSYRRFLAGYCFSVVLLAGLYLFAYYKHVTDQGSQLGAGVPLALVGLLLTTLVGASAATCIRAVALAGQPATRQKPPQNTEDTQ
jgi:hypothetical protein